MARKKGKRPKTRKVRIKRTSQAKRFVFSVVRNTYSLLRDVMRENEKLMNPVQRGVMMSEQEATARVLNKLLSEKARDLFQPFIDDFKNLKIKRVGGKTKNIFLDAWNVFYNVRDNGAFTLERDANFRLQLLSQLKRESVNIYDPHELSKALGGYTIDELLKIHEETPDMGEWVVSDQDVTTTKHPLQDFVSNMLLNHGVDERPIKLEKANKYLEMIDPDLLELGV